MSKSIDMARITKGKTVILTREDIDILIDKGILEIEDLTLIYRKSDGPVEKTSNVPHVVVTKTR